ncbi:MAG: response regulator [Bdellovibrionales bacterium]
MSAKQARFLLVDDFEIVRVMLRNILVEQGFSAIDEARDGRQAIAKLTDAHSTGQPFDVILCDWNMPEVTGMDVLEYCRSESAYRELPFIMITAEADQASVIAALKAGATDYLVKPIVPEILARKVNKIMGKNQGAA